MSFERRASAVCPFSRISVFLVSLKDVRNFFLRAGSWGVEAKVFERHTFMPFYLCFIVAIFSSFSGNDLVPRTPGVELPSTSFFLPRCE